MILQNYLLLDLKLIHLLFLIKQYLHFHQIFFLFFLTHSSIKQFPGAYIISIKSFSISLSDLIDVIFVIPPIFIIFIGKSNLNFFENFFEIT